MKKDMITSGHCSISQLNSNDLVIEFKGKRHTVLYQAYNYDADVSSYIIKVDNSYVVIPDPKCGIKQDYSNYGFVDIRSAIGYALSYVATADFKPLQDAEKEDK